ncbi:MULTISPECIES: ABC transporter substrate-binding protein [Aminobacter]|uniref:Peptide/nickel transport system substrate-binding protein n=1 Tax=Aminobacter niigataensis TaxID=83265 RepID=A0ABR6KXU2_9HYPH|nr:MULTISPECIES: ABC transporter substrate-binding protein [Aminobacter]MBB4649353.1 peptide/nickel transport system substrate-binding protein [Aminobacter niigataensis]CAI2934755.1 Hemin-binding lipoprotein [Aminobacter niigataensis]
MKKSGLFGMDLAASRRDFLKGSIGAGLLLGSGMGTAWAQTEQAGTPVKGGHLKLGLDGGSSTDSLDPAAYISAIAFCLARSFGDHLVESDPVTGKAIPSIAESWESSDNSKTWTFKIRNDVQFHNGKKLTVDDVVKTLQRHSDEKSRSGALGFLRAITSIEGSGNDLVVKLSESNVDLPLIFTAYHLVIQPNGGYDNPGEGVGTGPYKLVSFEPGVRALFEKNKNDWRERGHVDSFEIIAMNDPTARIAAVSAGRVHLINSVSAKTVPLLKRAPGVQILNTPSRGHYTFPMQVDKAPFDNNDLRLALKYAIDREAMLQTVLGGYGTIGNDFPINSTYPYFPAEIEQRSYDPDKAAFHFKKSGHDGPIVLRTSDGVYAGAVDGALLYQESAKKAGIAIEVKREPADGYWTNVWRAAPFCMSYYGSRLSQDLMYSTEHTSDSPANETNFKRPDFDKLIKQARVEADEAKRKELYHAAAVMVRDEGGSITPVFNDHLLAATKELKGYVHDVGNDLSNGYVASRAWLEA